MLADDGIKYKGKGGITDEQARRIYHEGVAETFRGWDPGDSEAIVNYRQRPYHVVTKYTLKGRRVVTVKRAGS